MYVPGSILHHYSGLSIHTWLGVCVCVNNANTYILTTSSQCVIDLVCVCISIYIYLYVYEQTK